MKLNGIKRILCAALAALLAITWSFCVHAEPSVAVSAAQDGADKPVLLLMGDSIAEGYAIRNRDEASYGRIAADTIGYEYRNIAHAAMDSRDLIWYIENGYEILDYVFDEEIGDYVITEQCSTRDYVAEADIICLSIGANDYFAQSNTKEMLIEAVLGQDDPEFDAIAARYYENLCTIIDQIDSINPHAVIILQKMYLAWGGLGRRANRILNEHINGAIETYDRMHPGRIHIFDLGAVMDRKPQYLADDCTHPNAKGNVAIAEALLQTLHDLGLCSETTPVVNVPGEDWSFFISHGRNRFEGLLITAAVMLATGNGINIFRVLNDVVR